MSYEFVVERVKHKPSTCPKCGVTNGWKRFSCVNPTCSTQFMKPKSSDNAPA